jgi:hypothetical protein
MFTVEKRKTRSRNQKINKFPEEKEKKMERSGANNVVTKDGLYLNKVSTETTILTLSSLHFFCECTPSYIIYPVPARSMMRTGEVIDIFEVSLVTLGSLNPKVLSDLRTNT